MTIDYKKAGVDVEAGYEAVRLMKQYVKTTYNDSVLGDIGSFGGFTPWATNPILPLWWRERTE